MSFFLASLKNFEYETCNTVAFRFISLVISDPPDPPPPNAASYAYARNETHAYAATIFVARFTSANVA